MFGSLNHTNEGTCLKYVQVRISNSRAAVLDGIDIGDNCRKTISNAFGHWLGW